MSPAPVFRLVAVALLATVSGLLVSAPPTGAADSPQLVPSDVETVPVDSTGDAIDDPAIWVHPTDASRSLVMANDKVGGFETYDLEGNRVQRLAFGTQFWGNVDVRQGVSISGVTHDLVAVVQQGVRLYSVDPESRLLSPITEGGAPVGSSGEGFCLYRSPASQRLYGVVITRAGNVTQFEITDQDADGLLESSTVRTFAVGSEAEGCVADDDSGALYISEEDVALWRYSAEPQGGTSRVAVDVLTSAGGHLVADIEGVTIVAQSGGTGYLIVSAQNVDDPDASYFSVYRREGANDFVKTFRVSDGTNSDDCDRTDGVAAVTTNLGASFPRGLFVCQDNNNDAPGTAGNQDLKLVRLEKVVDLDSEPPPPVPDSISFVGQATRSANSTSFAVEVPAAVDPGDALLTFASAGSDRVLTGPGAGWTQVGRVVDDTHATTVWSRVAAAGDAGSTVRVTSGGGYTKVGLTLVAYRGTHPVAPVGSITGVDEPGTTSAHTTPVVANTINGARRVSYWSDKSSATTRWTAPDGEAVRASTFGSGGGRVATLLTDLPEALAAGVPGSTGGLTATADATASKATMWTILLRPAEAGPPVNQSPTAAFTRTCTGLTCTFDGTGSFDPEGPLTAWAWDLGDGAAGDDPTVIHSYPADGTYTVRLTVTDASGATDISEETFTLATTPPPAAIAFVGQATRNANSTSFAVPVPPSVQAGDVLVLFVSKANATVLTTPGAGWSQIGEVVDGEVTTVWRKVATATDSGSTVRLTSGTTYVKVALTLGAYRGVDPTDPVARIVGVAEPVSTASHTAPNVANDVDGAWRVSYWSDKNSATTGWIAPAGETTRAVTVGTGGGRVSGLLTDSAGPLTAGTPALTGAGTAVASAPTSTATMWTLLLRPG